MFTLYFVKLIGIILVLSALILAGVIAGEIPQGNQANVLTALIAFIVGGVGVMMALGWFSSPENTSQPEQD